MSNRKVPKSDMVAKSKKKVLACSTPEHRIDSPSRDSDSVCDSDAGSPVPFFCTQDGAEGETDVVWNFYTPKADKGTSRIKNTTPLSRKPRKIRSKFIEKPLPKRKSVVRPSQKKAELFQDLIELNQNLHVFIGKKATDKPTSCSDDDIFSDTSESSPKSGLKSSHHCLRKNVLSSKFKKPEPEPELESDDSINECLLRASQTLEEHLFKEHSAPKRPCIEKSKSNAIADQDSMDSVLGSMKLESPYLKNARKCDSPRLNNDSFDNLLGDLNDSALERLSQMPVKDLKVTSTKDSGWVLQDMLGDSPLSKSIFGRHNSMPESPSFNEINKPSTSGMALGRYSSMPFNKSDEKINGDSPIRCTPDEIKKKHQQAREKLLAKRLLPFTASQQPSQIPVSQAKIPRDPKPIRKRVFQPKMPSKPLQVLADAKPNSIPSNLTKPPANNDSNLKLIIEKKRQEALMKLRRRQPK